MTPDTCPVCASKDVSVTKKFACLECGTCGTLFDDDLEPEDLDGSGDFNDAMDGDHESALASAGFGTDEDYGGGCFGIDGMEPDYE